MSHIDLEQVTIANRRLSFAESDVREYITDGEDGMSSVSKSEERECRICQMNDGSYGEDLIELGCSCKEDLAFAHRLCAEIWFKLKGNELCEICHSVATNVPGANEMIEEKEEEVVVVVEEGGGGGGDATVGEAGESWWNNLLLSFMLIFLVSTIVYLCLQKH